MFHDVTGPEYDKLFLKQTYVWFVDSKFWFKTDRNDVSDNVSTRSLKRSLIYCGSNLCTTLYIVFALLTRAFSSKDEILSILLALLKSEYPVPKIILQTLLRFIHLGNIIHVRRWIFPYDIAIIEMWLVVSFIKEWSMLHTEIGFVSLIKAKIYEEIFVQTHWKS